MVTKVSATLWMSHEEEVIIRYVFWVVFGNENGGDQRSGRPPTSTDRPPGKTQQEANLLKRIAGVPEWFI